MQEQRYPFLPVYVACQSHRRCKNRGTHSYQCMWHVKVTGGARTEVPIPTSVCGMSKSQEVQEQRYPFLPVYVACQSHRRCKNRGTHSYQCMWHVKVTGGARTEVPIPTSVCGMSKSQEVQEQRYPFLPVYVACQSHRRCKNKGTLSYQCMWHFKVTAGARTGTHSYQCMWYLNSQWLQELCYPALPANE